MKLQYKLYLFFAGVVLLPLLIATIAATLVLGRSGVETYENRMNSGLAAASVIITGQAQVLTGDFQRGLENLDTARLLGPDPAGRQAALDSLMQAAQAQRASITDSQGGTVLTSGVPPDEENPWLVSSARLPAGVGDNLVLSVFRPFDESGLNLVFRSQGLQWGFIQPDQFLDDDMISSVIDIPGDITDREADVYAAVDSETATAAGDQALQVGVGLMMMVALFAAFLGFMMARSITGPLRQLTDVAAAGTRGDLERRVQVRSRDEIGSLARSFNQMQDSIQNYISEIEERRAQLQLALSYTGSILGSTADRSGLIKTTAEAARLASSADAVWVEVFESREPPVHSALSAAAPTGFFDTGSTAAISRFSRDVSAGNLSAGEAHQFGNGCIVIAFPMERSRKTLGIMSAVFRDAAQLDESRRKILDSLAAQAASALENVNHADLQKMLSLTDPMTGLHNFRYLDSFIGRELNKSRRYGHELSLAIIDLDDFKNVNDVYGHHVGDEVLKAVAGKLLENVRGADMVARYGGEEFVVVFPETPKDAVLGAAEKLREAIASIELVDYPQIDVAASLGVASFPDDATESSGLMVKADEALYVSKKNGKNRVTAA